MMIDKFSQSKGQFVFLVYPIDFYPLDVFYNRNENKNLNMKNIIVE